jgi:hypothetical protein
MVSPGIAGDEDDRYLAYLSKPPSNLDTFVAAFETNVHEDDIWHVLHCAQKGLLTV